nr:hypothetical protein [Monilinia fructicola fusarivirus 2]
MEHSPNTNKMSVTIFITDLKEINGYGINANDITDPSTEIWCVRMPVKGWNKQTGLHAVIFKKTNTGVNKIVFPFGNLLPGTLVDKKHFPPGEAVQFDKSMTLPVAGAETAERVKEVLRANLMDRKLFGYWDYLSPISPFVTKAFDWGLWTKKNAPPQFVTTRTVNKSEISVRADAIIRACKNAEEGTPYMEDLVVLTSFLSDKLDILTDVGLERVCGFFNQIGGAWQKSRSPLPVGGILKGYGWPATLEKSVEERLRLFISKTNVIGASGLQSRSNFKKGKITRKVIKQGRRNPPPKPTIRVQMVEDGSEKSFETIRRVATDEAPSVQQAPLTEIEPKPEVDDDLSGEDYLSESHPLNKGKAPQQPEEHDFRSSVHDWMSRTAKAAKKRRKRVGSTSLSWWKIAVGKVSSFYKAEASITHPNEWEPSEISKSSWGEKLMAVPLVPVVAVIATAKRFRMRLGGAGAVWWRYCLSAVASPFNLLGSLLDGLSNSVWTLGVKMGDFVFAFFK